MIKKIAPLPKHIALIMDGNGRWAKQRNLPRLAGHRAGMSTTRSLVKTIGKYGIKFVTLYTFSTENWNRPKDEVNGILGILGRSIDKEAPKLHENGVKIHHIGHLERLPENLRVSIENAIELTKNNTEMTLSLAFDYGGRTEILDAVRSIITDRIEAKDIDENLFNNYLYTVDLPEVDLVVRTGGDLRISNFLLWQSAYSEFYFTDVLWPDFNAKEIEKALISYSQRQRRFGGL
ncbi:MAG: isoprenyl transferase [Dehalococcoidales bacterium]|nr:isoprenyl transferase [Dehalococcoidales bacterium]